jgi:hypothetical protein
MPLGLFPSASRLVAAAIDDTNVAILSQARVSSDITQATLEWVVEPRNLVPLACIAIDLVPGDRIDPGRSPGTPSKPGNYDEQNQGIEEL